MWDIPPNRKARSAPATSPSSSSICALRRRIEEKLKAEGFAETRLLLTEGKARRSLVKRVAAANDLHADLLLSIHHDSVPNKFLEDWEFEGKKSRFSDRFSGYSVFVSRSNPDFKTSLAFAELIGKEMKAQGLDYAQQYSQADHGPVPASAAEQGNRRLSLRRAHRAEKDPDGRRPAGGGLDHQPGRRAQDGFARAPGHHQQRCRGGREGILRAPMGHARSALMARCRPHSHRDSGPADFNPLTAS